MTKNERIRALKAADPETYDWIEDIWESIFPEDDEIEAENPDEWNLMNRKTDEEKAAVGYEV
ncbi:MAG: hypothetical protein IIZ93_02620 [Acidaminococcaceae bacterium]|nr:hypothetical protein [Acidaminococcaceae bacterium]